MVSDDDFGLSATAYFARWQVDEDPFGTFPPSDLLPQGMSTTFKTEGQYRTGLNFDADYILPADNHIIFGGEVFADLVQPIKQEFPVDPTDPDEVHVMFSTVPRIMVSPPFGRVTVITPSPGGGGTESAMEKAPSPVSVTLASLLDVIRIW